MPDPDRRQQLIAFFSADMANSTEFKNRHQARYSDGNLIPPRWPSYFSEIFSRVLQRFDEEMRKRRKLGRSTLLARPRLWKINGDELLFSELILPGEDGLKWLAQAVEAFLATIEAIDEEMLPDGCGLRGCVWSAGFPIRNKQIKVSSQQDPPIIRLEPDDTILPDFDTGLYYGNDVGLVDYLGPDMDRGFRLAAITPPGRVVCSLDASYLLMQRFDSPPIFHVGWRELKGIGGGAPYPIFWCSSGTERRARHPWEQPASMPELNSFLNSSALRLNEFMRIAEEYWTQLRDYFNRPYTSPEDITPEHLRIWQLVEDNPQEYGTIYLQDSP